MPRRQATPILERCNLFGSIFKITAASLPRHLTWYPLFHCCLFQLGTVLYLTLSSGDLHVSSYPRIQCFFLVSVYSWEVFSCAFCFAWCEDKPSVQTKMFKGIFHYFKQSCLLRWLQYSYYADSKHIQVIFPLRKRKIFYTVLLILLRFQENQAHIHPPAVIWYIFESFLHYRFALF